MCAKTHDCCCKVFCQFFFLIFRLFVITDFWTFEYDSIARKLIEMILTRLFKTNLSTIFFV